jgi:hypothetical protein
MADARGDKSTCRQVCTSALKSQFVRGLDFNATTKFTEVSMLRRRCMARLLKVSPRLPVRNLARTIEFYTSVLDLETSGSWPADEPTFVILERDDTILQFRSKLLLFEKDEFCAGK